MYHFSGQCVAAFGEQPEVFVTPQQGHHTPLSQASATFRITDPPQQFDVLACVQIKRKSLFLFLILFTFQ